MSIDNSRKLWCFILSTLAACVLGGGMRSLMPPWALAQPSRQDLPITGRAVHFGHVVNPGQSRRVPAEGGPYVRAQIRLADGVLVGDWGIEILEIGGRTVQHIDSGSLKSGIWTFQVWGPELTVRVPNNGGRVLIEERLRLEAPLPVQNVIPPGSNPNFRWAISYPDPGVREAARTVVQVRMMHGEEEKPCTGFILAPTLVMTNQHCVPTSEIARQGTVLVGYDSLNAAPREILASVELVTSDIDLDYSVIRVAVPLLNRIPRMRWRISGPVAQERIVIVQHPNGQPKQVADDNDCYVSEAWTRGRSDKLVDFGHRCDTMDGSSGSLVLGLSDLHVVGIHHWGIRPGDEGGQNQGVRADEILLHLQQNAHGNPRIEEVYNAIISEF